MNTFIDLYNHIISLNDDNIFTFLNDKWDGKDKQESLFRLFAFSDIIPDFYNYFITDGNFNNGTICKNTNKSLLFNRSLKDKGDISDLTLINNTDDIIIVSTSKNIKDYHLNDLDIDNIQNIYLQKYKHKYDLRICIIVKDKKDLFNIVSRSEISSIRLKETINNNNTIIFDWNDINLWYINFKLIYKNKTINDIIKIIKKPLINRFHQELSIINTLTLSKTHKSILWGHIPRSGKSYIMAGLIAISNNNNYLIITTAPNETISQYLEIFNSYLQFDEFTIINLNDSKKKPKLGNKNIIICSKQYLQSKGVKEDKIKQIKWLKDINFDWRFIDESHNGGTTELAKQVLLTYGNNVNTITIYITATFIKPINYYNIPKEAWIMWDLEDINLCKTIDKQDSINKLSFKHGDNVINILNKYSSDHIINDYIIYPKLELLSWDFKDTIKDTIIEKYKNKDTIEGFSTDALFLLKHKNKEPIKEFQDENGVINLLYSIFGKIDVYDKDELLFIKSKNSIFDRIEKICKNGNINSRWFSCDEPLTVLAFLPCGLHGTPIDLLQETLYDLIKKYDILPDFEIIYINSINNGNKTSIEIINDARNIVKLNNKKGLLVLSGRMCSLAVSLAHCDIVLMLNNTESIDSYFQMMFRSMTEASNKKCGFVIDLNLQRVSNVIIDYAMKITNNNKKNLNIKDSIKYVLEQNLIGFNSDNWMHHYFGLTNINIDFIIDKIYNIYTSKPSNAIENILKTLELKVKILSYDQELFNKLFHTTASSKEIKELIEELTKNTEIDKGIKKIKLEEDIDNDSITSSNDKKYKDVNFIDDIMKHLLPLLCLLTIHNTDITTFNEICEWINKNNIEKNIIQNQLSIWWGKTLISSVNIINLFIILYNKYLSNNDDFNNIFMRLKEMFNIAKNNKGELSRLIDKYLIPQEIEKKQNAEVSTPYSLRQEMINKIPDDFWTTPKKVFEPCSGKGGFLLDIIDKFMIGLKDYENDVEKRYKLIIEQCLYFSEYNPINVFICKLLLDPFIKYKLNYNEGDTLKLDIKEKWSLDGFDAVIGNPPYQDINGASNGTLWDKFVLYGINNLKINGNLLFIHPSGWRNIYGKFKNIQIELKKYWIKYLEIHNENDGIKNFKAETRYDWYLLEKNNNNNLKTIINFEDNELLELNLKELEFIPNGLYNLYNSLLAKENEEKCEVLHSYSLYDPRKNWMSKIKTINNIYPIVYMINNKDVIKPLYSSINNGHIGISKLIWSNGRIKSIGSYIDNNGDYGMTCFAYAIVDDSNNLENIKKAFDSKKFRKLMEMCAVGQLTINYKIIGLFKKDFYKEFIYNK